MTDEPMLTGRRLLVVAAFFPSRIQPWMLNATIQAIRHGADVYIAATRRQGETYQAAVDHHRLLSHTIYVQPTNRWGVLGPLRYLLGPSEDLRRAARIGLVRALVGHGHPWASGRTRLWLDPRSIAKGLALAVPIGLDPLDLIHAHSMTLGYEFLRVAKARRIPLVQTFHGLHPAGVEGLPASRMTRLFHEAACFLVNTESARRQLTERGCPSDKIHILPQGTDLSEFPYEPHPHPGHAPVRLLSVGRLHEDKGHIYAIRALARLSSEGLAFLYRIVGVGPNRLMLEAEAVRLGIGDRVVLTGELDDEALRREYASAHIFLFPSLRDVSGKHEETQGVAMQEAQASGCIVIATRTGGIPESVDETHAFLVPDRDAEALAAAIRSVLQQPQRWQEWQAAGRGWVQDRYAIEVIGRRLAELYRSLLNGSEA